jgi:hypothetical protein
MTSGSASDHGNPAEIAVSLPKGTTLKGLGGGGIEISVSGKAKAEEFRGLLGSTSYCRFITNTVSHVAD